MQTFKLQSSRRIHCELNSCYLQISNIVSDSMDLSNIFLWLVWKCDGYWCQEYSKRYHQVQVIYHVLLCCFDKILSCIFLLSMIDGFRRITWLVGRPFTWWVTVRPESVWIHPDNKTCLPVFQMRVLFIIFFNFKLPFSA